MNKNPLRLLALVIAVATVPIVSLAANAATSPAASVKVSTSCSAMTADVFASVNPRTGASLLSRHQTEIQNAKTKNGFTGGGGVSFKASAVASTGLVPVYRLFKNGDFMWVPQTANTTEYTTAQTKWGYKSQQIDFYASATPLDCSVPVYRFQKNETHRMAITAADQAALKAAGWTSEGARFWVVSAAEAVPAPVPSSPPTATPQPTAKPSATPTATPTSAPTASPKPSATAVAKPTTAPTTAPAVPPAIGADYVQWASIAKPGQNINQVLANPALNGKILQLPAGVFEVSNFLDSAKAISVPPTVKGIVGAGLDTIIRIKAGTSTYAHTVPSQSAGGTNQLYVMRMNGGKTAQILSDFWLQGTEQGHLYNGLMVGQSQPGTTVKNLLITGMPGDNGAPPGETFGLNWWRGSDSITRDIEIDGHRVTGNTYASRVVGAVVGASPFGYNDHNGAKLYNVYTHDSNVGMPTFWQSNNAQTWNLQSIRNATGINHERSFGIVHNEPVIYGSKKRTHISFMSDQGNGKLTIIGALTDTWINSLTSGPIGVGAKMLILTPKNYVGPNTNTITTAPVVLGKDGKTTVAYTWAH